MQSSTKKYLLIAGVAAVGYYLYTRNSASSSAPAVGGSPDPAQVAFVQSWATGLTGSNAVNFQNTLPSLSAADISQFASIIKAWEGLRPLTDADYSFWASMSQRIGLV